MDVLSGVAVGAVAGFAVRPVLERIPAQWLVDYDETPDERHEPGRRFTAFTSFAPPLILAILGAFVAVRVDSFSQATVMFGALWLLVCIAWADGRFQIIPDQFIIGLFVLGTLEALLGTDFGPAFWSRIAGAVVGGGFLLMVGWVGALVTRRDAMGFGDVKLLVAVGFLVGLPLVPGVLLLTVLCAGLAFGALMALGKLKSGEMTALGPYIAGAAAATLVFSDQIDAVFSAYVALFGG